MDRQQTQRINQSGEFVKCLGDFFNRNLLSIPLIKNYPHQSIYQRCGLRAATLELDTAAHPNIEYLAGTRLSVYPLNPTDHAQVVLKHLIDDVGPGASSSVRPPAPASPKDANDNNNNNNNNNNSSGQKKQAAAAAAATSSAGPKVSPEEAWSRFVQLNGKDSLRLALVYLYDITMAPSRDLVRIMAECCSNKEHKARLIAISQTEDTWERWICSGQRTLKSTFEEFSSCRLSAKSLLSELSPQQPRQYSVSSIRSSKRFRAEVIVFQHKFTPRQIQNNLQNIRDRELLELRAVTPNDEQTATGGKCQQHHHHQTTTTTTTSTAIGRPAVTKSGRSLRSMRSMAAFSSSPISTHQVHQVPNFSGPLMSMYASSTMSSLGAASSSGQSSASSPGSQQQQQHRQHSTGVGGKPRRNSGSLDRPGRAGVRRSSLAMSSKQEKGMMMGTASSLTSQAGAPDTIRAATSKTGHSPSADHNNNNHHHQQHQHQHQNKKTRKSHSASTDAKSLMFDGLCSNYLLNLNSNDHIICEFVENPRFTLKGNRERPILMIGQDVGVVAFRPFWQQRSLEHDRAQVFYTLFKDLAPKKFGDMRLVCLTGNRCRIEELFRREINLAQVAKILSSVSYINRAHFGSLLDLSAIRNAPPAATAAAPTSPSANVKSGTQRAGPNIKIDSKELIELGNVIYKLLIEQNGCLYTCCDPQLTQAIEILTVESIARNNSSLSRERIMTLLPLWKGRPPSTLGSAPSGAMPSTGTGTATTPNAPATTTTTTTTTITSTSTTANDNKYLFTLENQYEKSMIVQEIYDASI